MICSPFTPNTTNPVGATWLPVALCTLPMSPNHHPTTAQGSPGVVGGHPQIAIFQPTHAGLKMTKS